MFDTLGNRLDADDDRERQLEPAQAAAPAEEPIAQRSLRQQRDSGALQERGKVAAVSLLLGHE